MVKLTEFVQKILGFALENWKNGKFRFPAYVLVRKQAQREEFKRYVQKRGKKYIGV